MAERGTNVREPYPLQLGLKPDQWLAQPNPTVGSRAISITTRIETLK